MSTSITSEETLVIETPERVPLYFAVASIGNRFLACAIDHTLQIIVILVVALGLFIIGEAGNLGSRIVNAPKWAKAAVVILSFSIFFGYFVFFEWAWNGQTPGKRLLKLRVIRDDGRPVTFWEAMVRNILRVLDMMPAPFYSIGLVCVFVSRQDQRVGDMVAGSLVVRERAEEAPSFTEVFAAPTSDAALRRSYKPLPFTADLTDLTEREISVVETFLRRRWDLPDAPRQWMAYRVALPILYKLRPEYDLATFTYEAFLEELLHRYRAQHPFAD